LYSYIFCRRRRMTCLWTWTWKTRIWRRKWALSGIGTYVWALPYFFKLKGQQARKQTG
jgi:hypothetical protein